LKSIVSLSASSVASRETVATPEFVELCPRCKLGLLQDMSMRSNSPTRMDYKYCRLCAYRGQESIYYVRQMGKLPE